MHASVQLPNDHTEKDSGKTAIILVNLGSPDAPTAKALRPYLKQFLSDPRVVEIPRPIWWCILNGIILNTRPKKSAHAYEQIWDHTRDLSPLIAHTIDQTTALATYYQDNPMITVTYAMRYGNPALGERIASLHEAGYDRQLIVPLYPQYSASTTATVFDEVAATLKTMRHQPALRFVPPYYDHPQYIQALAERTRAHLDNLDWEPEHYIASYHGIPKRYFEQGDPYHCHCAKTTRLLNEALGKPYGQWQMCFQSLFGKAEWLKPYTEPTLIDLAKNGAKRVALICPGFAADCLETLEEIEIGAQEAFREHGGEHFTLIPCLNASEAGSLMLQSICDQELSGWVNR